MREFFRQHWRRVIVITLAVGGGLIGLVGVGLMIGSPRLTPMLEGAKFREMLDRQTSKGLHFKGEYEPLRRTGFASVETPGFHAEDGVKAMKSLDAAGISGTFNPWGVLLRRWQLDSVHIKRGVVEVQTYEPKPDPPKHRPWYAIFMPDRVYLREVTCDDADVTWRMRGKSAGIFHTRLLITPYGRDFEYQAKGGALRTNGQAPTMDVGAIHLLITKTIMKVDRLELATREGGAIRVTGEAGMRDDKHVDARLELDRVAVAPWLPASIARGVGGRARGAVTWRGEAQTLEAAKIDGELRVDGGELSDLPLLDYLASATGRKTLEKTALDRCAATFRWASPRFEITSLDLGSKGKFSLRGTMTVSRGGGLGGTLELGVAPGLLDWLPRAREEVFTRAEGGLLWTKVRLSGSLERPENDLTPRLAAALKRDPGAAAGLLLRGAGEWLEQKTRGR